EGWAVVGRRACGVHQRAVNVGLLWRRVWRGLRSGGLPRRRRRRGAALDGVRLVVKSNDVLRDVHLAGSVQHWGALRGSIQHKRVAVFARVAIEHIEQLPTDTVENFALGRVHFLLELLLLALELPC